MAPAQPWVELLAEVVAHHERLGVLIANPHFHTVEDGAGHRRVGDGQPAMKADMDPLALPNPGKMRSHVPAAQGSFKDVACS